MIYRMMYWDDGLGKRKEGGGRGRKEGGGEIDERLVEQWLATAAV